MTFKCKQRKVFLSSTRNEIYCKVSQSIFRSDWNSCSIVFFGFPNNSLDKGKTIRVPNRLRIPFPLLGFEDYTVFIKNSISFPRFGEGYERKNMREPADKSAICVYEKVLTNKDLICMLTATVLHFRVTPMTDYVPFSDWVTSWS